jgi:hypothetical protein
VWKVRDGLELEGSASVAVVEGLMHPPDLVVVRAASLAEETPTPRPQDGTMMA